MQPNPSIWMVDCMADELKAVAPGEGIHLGNDHRSFSGASDHAAHGAREPDWCCR